MSCSYQRKRLIKLLEPLLSAAPIGIDISDTVKRPRNFQLIA